MKIVITENQKESLIIKLQKMIDKFGYKKASKAVGGLKNLVDIGFDNNPMKFLDMYNDLDVVSSKDEENVTLFKKNGENVIVYYENEDRVIPNANIFYYPLRAGFNLDYYGSMGLFSKWIKKNYGIGHIYNIEFIDFDGEEFHKLKEIN